MTKLSEHFSFDELTVTESRPDLQEVNRVDAANYKSSLTSLCETILEPLRAQFGAIKINSGFRCEALNSAIGGSPTSQHRFGAAADIDEKDDARRVEMALWLKASGISFGQCLIERGGCLHVSLPGSHVGQVGRAAKEDGKWVVKPLEVA